MLCYLAMPTCNNTQQYAFNIKDINAEGIVTLSKLINVNGTINTPTGVNISDVYALNSKLIVGDSKGPLYQTFDLGNSDHTGLVNISDFRIPHGQHVVVNLINCYIQKCTMRSDA